MVFIRILEKLVGDQQLLTLALLKSVKLQVVERRENQNFLKNLLTNSQDFQAIMVLIVMCSHFL